MFRRIIGAMALLLAGLAPAFAGVDIRVDLSSQRMTVTTPDGDTRNWAISSGKEGKRTPRGNYRPTVMKTYHWSRKYHGHMPHAIFFRGGYAIHGTDAVRRLGRPASNGCIRLHPAHARELFQMVKQHGQGSTRIAINGAVSSDTMLAERRRAVPRERVVQRRAPRAEQPMTVYSYQPVERQQSAVGRFQIIERAYAPAQIYPYQPNWRQLRR
jgi:L,D-transpeptidase catalytic domain